MSFDWLDYYHLAKELHKAPQDAHYRDARLRSSVSRAYYSVFCLAKGYLCEVEKVTVPPGPEAHAAVEAEFRSRDRVVSSSLQRLRKDRNAADYNTVIEGLDSKAAKSMIQAEAAITRLRAKR